MWILSFISELTGKRKRIFAVAAGSCITTAFWPVLFAVNNAHCRDHIQLAVKITHFLINCKRFLPPHAQSNIITVVSIAE